MSNLWSWNTPEEFWQLDRVFTQRDWQDVARKALPLLHLSGSETNLQELLTLVLGEAQYGNDHWRMGVLTKLYYLLKPIVPRFLTRFLRKLYSKSFRGKGQIRHWPLDTRYAEFQWEIIRQLLIETNNKVAMHKDFWPEGRQFAFVLTHDIETAKGQTFVRNVADLEESLGLRSSFNFVLERYPLNYKLMQELRERGFEIGCHGLKHDGRLFYSRSIFEKRVIRINRRMKDYGMVGFRSPLTLRNPEWMQTLEIEYDSSFFDTDPFEPIPGGGMCIWPFFLGRFVELPYTLVQDHTLIQVLGETTPRIWLEKVKFIQMYHGMALLNTHPDYLMDGKALEIYTEFLQSMRQMRGDWHALPRDVARWWKTRASSAADQENVILSRLTLDRENNLFVER